ncbi:MAG: sugar phosphate isomerase/epimerase family protein [Sphaerochaetaceae bacterium]|nr:sugar phosphate isomerase/epimerase [Spirochaetales bacterium]MDY5499632.1 sugar phosphate isomerase/epimerase family protein [Sphaerochaetaceae bacterium]
MRRIIGFRAHDLGSFSSLSDLAKFAASFQKPTVIHLALHKVLKGKERPVEKYDGAYVQEIHDTLAREGVSISMIGSYFNPIHPDPEIRQAQINRYIINLKYTREFGCRIVGTETGSHNPDIKYDMATYEPENFDLCLKTIEQLVNAAEKYDALACIEPVSHHHTISTVERALKVSETFKSEHFGFIYDPVNLVPYTGIPESDGSVRERPSDEAQERFFRSAFDAWGSRIKTIHIKDYRLNPTDGTKIGNIMAGTGVVNWKLFFRLMDEYHIQVPMSMENIQVPLLADELKTLLSY